MDSQVLLVAHFEKGPPQRLVVERLGDLTPAQQKAAQAAAARAADDAIAFFNRGKTLKTSVPSLRTTVKNVPVAPSKKSTVANVPAVPSKKSTVANVPAVPSKKPTVANAPVPSKKPTVANAPVPSKKPTVANAPSEERPAFLSDVKWTDNELDPRTLRALTETMGYEYMSKVQEATLSTALASKNIFARGRTGTGKSVGFLVPTIEQLAKNPPPKGQIGALIVSHNRDLAHQLHVEAEKLLTFHDLKAQVVVGGENIGPQKRKLANDRVDILIGTPGRLVDHIESTPGVAEQLAGVRILILDEADELLDSGFKKSLDIIVNSIKGPHQTLFFSATVSQSVRDTANEYMNNEYEFIDTVGDDAEQTNVKVPQEYVIAPFEQSTIILYNLLNNHIVKKQESAKIIVFFPTAKETAYMAELFTTMGFTVSEMHSRLSQSQRNRISEEFKHAKSGIMFASDVLARGYDATDVTYVIQVGLPDSAAQSVHRVGRTGRGGKEGSGVIVLSPEEARAFLPELEKLGVPISPSTAESTITGGIISGQASYEAPEKLAVTIESVSTHRELRKSAEQAYMALLGYYNGHTKRMKITKADMVVMCNNFYLHNGLKELPGISSRTLKKMGLSGVAGIKETSGGGMRHTQRRSYAKRNITRKRV